MITEIFNIKYPIIQAPMAGGVTSTELVSSVSKAGGLGMIGAGYMNSSILGKQIQDINKLTSTNFGVNLFIPSEFMVSDYEWDDGIRKLLPFFKEFNIDPRKIIKPKYEDIYQSYLDQIETIVKEQVSVCSFTFGLPSVEVIKKLKNNGVTLVGTATNIKEAVLAQELGMDAVVVQGYEAGGHRGTFIGDVEAGLIGLFSLLPQVVDQLSIPVIAAGGIMDGRAVSAALCLGASGVQMGTAFLTCIESGADPVYKEQILNASEDATVLTNSFSGKHARGIKNKFTSYMDQFENEILPFPVQNVLTGVLREIAKGQKNYEMMSLWSGQSPRLAKQQSVDMLINSIITDVNMSSRKLKL